MRKKGIALAVAAILLINTTSWGANVKDLKSELREHKNSISSKKEQLKDVKSQKVQLGNEIEILDRQIEGASSSIQKLNQQVQDCNISIEEKKRQLEEAQNKVVELDKILQSRLVALYKNGETTYIDILLDSNSLSDFFSRYLFVRTIVDQDKKLLDMTSKTKNAIIQAKNELESQKTKRENAMRISLAAKRSLDKYRGSRNKFFLQLSDKQRGIEAEIDEEVRESQSITSKIRQLQQGNRRVYKAGAFVWPVEGSCTITSPFGYRMHPILKKRKYHSGIDIAAAYGSTIVAAHSGTVIFADWYGGYGKAIIIDHGSGKSTLYGHTSKILVSAGQEVKAGEKIAEVGSTGLSTGPHCHFEVRENGSPVNPLNYVSR